jgi:hypothetical protein
MAARRFVFFVSHKRRPQCRWNFTPRRNVTNGARRTGVLSYLLQETSLVAIGGLDLFVLPPRRDVPIAGRRSGFLCYIIQYTFLLPLGGLGLFVLPPTKDFTMLLGGLLFVLPPWRDTPIAAMRPGFLPYLLQEMSLLPLDELDIFLPSKRDVTIAARRTGCFGLTSKKRRPSCS